MIHWPLVIVVLIAAPDTVPGAPDTVPGRVVLPISSSAVANGPRGSADSWTHDVGHFATPTVLAMSIFGVAREAGASRAASRWIAVGTSLAAAVLKEMYDRRSVDNFSGRDLAIGVAGTGVGLFLAERMNWSSNDSKRVR